ncbi:MAG TPA: SLBB domain-containing protein [Syntrophobacteraceae bacterium]|nr:SLBB domain-containing protein [Syntrophobacteraceae bacterium]
MTRRMKTIIAEALVFVLVLSSASMAQNLQAVPINPYPQQTIPSPPTMPGGYAQSMGTPQAQAQMSPLGPAPIAQPQPQVYHPGQIAPAPGVVGATSYPAGMQTPQTFPVQPGVPATQDISQAVPSSAFATTEEEPPSPFEQYVSGVIPSTLSFDIKQFGYDVFYKPSPTTFVPLKPVPGPSIQQPRGTTQPGGGFPGVPTQGVPGSVVSPQAPGGTLQGWPGMIPSGVPGQQVPQLSPAQPGLQPGGASSALSQKAAQLQGLLGPGANVQALVPQAQSPQARGQVPGTATSAAAALQSQIPSGTSVPYLRNNQYPLLQPVADVPVGPDYVLGPGDEVRVAVWGSVEGTWFVSVDRDGNITLPKVGVVGVAGLTYQELKEVLQKQLSKYYTDFEMNVSLGALRSIRVYLVGNARTPGAITVSSLSTIINALMVSGGPTKTGTLRNIELKRKGETITHLDVYDFLIRGDKTNDTRLMPEDVILIPPIGPIVGIAGNVATPAIYELKGKTRLSEGIKMAGGVTAAAYLQRVQVERVSKKQNKIILDLNLDKVKGKDDIYLEDGDIVKVFPINTVVTNRVVLQGSVRRAGEYEWKPGMRVKDLIPNTEALLPNTLFTYAAIERVVPPDYHPEYVTFSLEGLLIRKEEKENVKLEPFDVVTVYAKPDKLEKQVVQITGAVNTPGQFEFRPNMKLSDLVNIAGGLRPYAFMNSAEVTRVIPTQQGPKTEQIYVNLSEALAGNPQQDITLMENDYLFVRSVPDWQIYKKVYVYGEVNFPGEYAFKKGETVSSVIERAGGYTSRAYLRGTVFTRVSTKQVQQAQINEMVDRLEREMAAAGTADLTVATDPVEARVIQYQNAQKRVFVEGLRRVEAKGRMVVRLDHPAKMKKTSFDIPLEEGDMIFIPTNPQTVQVLGAVYNQTSFVYEPKRDYMYYVTKTGGYTSSADKKAVYVLKCDGTSVKPGSGLTWDHDSNEWRTGGSVVLEPGDTIIVPDQLDKMGWYVALKGITEVIYRIAVGTGILFRAF